MSPVVLVGIILGCLFLAAFWSPLIKEDDRPVTREFIATKLMWMFLMIVTWTSALILLLKDGGIL